MSSVNGNVVELSSCSYDADGNLLVDGHCEFSYDSAGRLKTASTNGWLVLANFYDAKSRRVKKVTPEATHTYFYDGWNLIEERVAYTGGTTSTIRYYWGKDLSGTLQGAGGVGGLLYLTVSDSSTSNTFTLQLYIPLYDNNGNITRYVDENGNTVAQYTYDAFGKLIAKSGPLADFFRHRFSTKYFDVETGLYYYGYRFYHPVLMRWLNRDPIEEEGGANIYAMCGNNSLSFFDALGKFKISYVTSRNATIWEKLKRLWSKKTKDIEPKNENDLYVECKPMNVNGAFHSSAFFDTDCYLEVRLEIWLHPDLMEEAKPQDEFVYDPHKMTVRDGCMIKKGGGHPVKGAVLAHERGHAKAFFLHQKSAFESKIAALRMKSRLTSDEKKKVEKAFKEAKKEVAPWSIKYSNENTKNWYINNGFNVIEEGGRYVFKRK